MITSSQVRPFEKRIQRPATVGKVSEEVHRLVDPQKLQIGQFKGWRWRGMEEL